MEGWSMRIFVASNNDLITAKLDEVVRSYGHECQISPLVPLDMAANRLAQANPEILIVVLSPQPEPALAFLKEPRNPEIQRVLAIGPVGEPKLRLGALREGADQFLDEAELKPELEAVLRRFSSHASQSAPPPANGRVISLLAPSGGSGSSTLAVNVATALAKEHKNCMLIDLNLGAGDLASLLDLKPAHTLADLCRHSARMDRAVFERSLVKHSCGVALLSPSRSFSDISQVTTQGVRDTLTLAKALFPYVVVDLDDSFHSEQTQTLRMSDVILLVLRLDFTSLRNTRRTLDHLEQLQISRQRVRLVVNRYGQPQELPVAKAEEALGIRISHFIPDDPKTINRANNNGIPAVLEAPSAKVSKVVLQLATSVNGQAKT
jgi:pilus assembly protein CpaE